jgi:hypothetical protein
VSRTGAFLLGALGGLLPILVSLLTIDLAPIIDHPDALSFGNYCGYCIRVLVLLLLGGAMALLNNEVKHPFAIVQLGIAAPALVTSFIHGAPGRLPPVQHAFFSIVSVANAQEQFSEPKKLQLAEGFLSDVFKGAGVRLDDVANANRAADAFNRPLGAPSNGVVNNAVGANYPQTMGVPPSSQLGNYCFTQAGAFGPGPYQPVGAPCTANTFYGQIMGQIGLPSYTPATPPSYGQVIPTVPVAPTPVPSNTPVPSDTSQPH